MKKIKSTNLKVFRLLALLLCLAATVPQLRAQTWTVAGANNGFLGSNWNTNDTNNDMVPADGTTYYYLAKTANVNAGSYAFKVVKNHSWDVAYPSNDYGYDVSSTGMWSIVYLFNTNGNAVSLFGPFKTLTVAGSQTELLGSSWSQTDSNNDMTSSDGINYKLTFTDVNVTAGNYAFKVVQDHAWTYAWPSSDKYYTISFTGVADVEYNFNIITKEVTVTVTEKSVTPVTPDYYITGDNGLGLGGWTYTPTIKMTKDANLDVYTYSSNVTTAGTYYFAFADGVGSSWDNFNGNHRIAPTSGNETVTLGSWANTQKGSGSYAVTVDAGQVTFTLDVTDVDNMRFKVEGTELVITPDYYVKGEDTNIFPDGWSTSSNTTQMTDNGNGTYTWTSGQFHLTAGTNYLYKIYASDGNWHPSSNQSFSGDVAGTYTVTITYDSNNETANAVLNLVQPDPSYDYDIYVRYTGEEPIANVYIYAWDAAGNLSDAWDGSTGGTPLSSLTTQEINGHTYYKVSYNSYSSTINAIFNENGSSSTQTANLTANPGDNYFTYNGGASVIGPSTEPDEEIIITYYVKGDNTTIFPNGWNEGESTAMTDNEDGTYTWTSGQFHLDMGTEYAYKVYGDDNTWHPSDVSGNLNFSSNVPGTYTVTITYDKNNETVNAQLNPIQLDQLNTYDIYVRYTGNEPIANVYIYAWDAASNLSDAWSGSTGGTSLSSLTTQEINGYTYYKVSYNSYSSTISVIFNENGSSSTQTANLTANPGDNYFTYGGGNTVDGPNDEADAALAYYAVGANTDIFPNGWNLGDGTVMTDNGDGTYSWTSSNVHLTPNVDYEYKVRDNQDNWYPSGNDNQTFNVNTPGTYTVTVTIDSNTGIVTAMTTLIAADPVNAMYVIGNAGSQQWAANAGIPMEYNDETGYYELHSIVLTANSYFAFASALGSNSDDWTTLNANRFNSTGDSNWAINDGWLNQWMGTQNYQDDDHNWYVEQSGAYDIDFNPNTHEVRVKRSYADLYISYGVNWTYENNSMKMTTVDGNLFQSTITLNEGDFFLFSTGLSDETALGATHPMYNITNVMIGFAQRLQSGTNNFHFIGASGKYIVVVNLEKNTVTLRKTADATVTKIYLQKTGYTVLDPAGGTYNGQTLPGKRGGIYAWNKLNLQDAGDTYQMTKDGPTNYTYEGEVENYGGNNYLKDLPDTTTADGKVWHAWSVSNSICEFYFIRQEYDDYKSQKVMRRAGEVWLIWTELDATHNRQDDAVACDSLMDVTSYYYDVTASGVSDCSTMLEDHYYVYYTNTTGWDQVYCYAWNEVDSLIRFTDVYPGNKCTFVGYDDDGYEVWCYDFGLMEDFHRIYGTDDNGDYIIPTGVIFNNGMNEDHTRQQTGDLPFDNGACYDYLGMVYLGNSLGGIINNGIVNGPKYTVEDDLIGVYYDENAITRVYETDMEGNPILDEQGKPKYIDVKGALYAKDFDKYTAKSKAFEGTTDYVYDICAHMATETYPGGSQIQIMRDFYDQSNWVKIVLSPNFDNVHLQNTDVTYDRDRFDEEDFESATDELRPEPYLMQYVDKIIPGGSMSGNLVNNVNPQMHITNIAMPIEMESPYEKNVYVTGHFNDTVVFSYVHQDWNPGTYNGVYRTVPHLETDPLTNQTYVDSVSVDYSRLYKMFYVAPKPQEIAYITWAVFDHPNLDGTVGTMDCTREPLEPGAFYAPMNWNRTGQLWDGLNPDDEFAPWGTTYGPYSNGFMQYGAFQVNWSLFEGMEIPPYDSNRPQKPWYQTFKPGQAYKILALIRYAYGEDIYDVQYQAGVYSTTDIDVDNYNDGTHSGNHVWNAPQRSNDTWADMERVPYDNLNMSKFIVFPLLGSDEDSNGNDLGNVTAVNEVVTQRTVIGTRYYNLMGVSSDKPFDGINIVVTTYSDGSRTSKKILR